MPILKFFTNRGAACFFIFFSPLLALVNLSTLEIQPYDEAYYVLRAKAIVLFDCWLDQTDYAVGGFYSGSHPPLLIWLMALSGKLFGHNAFTARLWSVAALAGSLWFIHALARRTSGYPEAFFAVLLLGFMPLVMWFSRVAQFDILVMMFSLAQVLCYTVYLDTENRKFLALGGVMLGLALLSKTLVGVFAGLAIGMHTLYRLWRKETSRKDFLVDNALFFSIGFGIGLSWFVLVCATHDGFFMRYLDWYIINRMQVNQVGSNHYTGYFYYLNVLVTRFPISLLGIIWVHRFLSDSNFRTSHRVLWLLWFIVPFVVLSLAETRLIWYFFIFLPPLVLVVSESAVIALGTMKDTMTRVALCFCGVAGIHSATQTWHRTILDSIFKTHDFFQTNEPLHLAVIVLLIVLVVGVLWVISRKDFAPSLFTRLTLPLCMVFGASVPVLQHSATMRPYSGTKGASECVHAQSPSAIFHFVEQKMLDDKIYTPHFSYYFNGIDIDSTRWQSHFFYRKFAIEDCDSILPSLLRTFPDAAIIVERIFRPQDELLFSKKADAIGLSRVFYERDYSVYIRKD